MQVKGQCSVIVDMFITKLDWCFVDLELMNALGIVYPQFWMQPYAYFSFSLNMAIINKHYCKIKRVKPSLL
jgi:hypothetical protein